MNPNLYNGTYATTTHTDLRNENITYGTRVAQITNEGNDPYSQLFFFIVFVVDCDIITLMISSGGEGGGRRILFIQISPMGEK